MKQIIIHTRTYREKLLQDDYRPVYHFAVPDGDARPGDPNGAFYADGKYHLMYLYKNYSTNAFHWAHISSRDLLHWRCHTDALTAENGDEGCYSGGAYVDEDGTAYLTFWKFPARNPAEDNGGIGIAFSKPPYEKWERIHPIAINGSAKHWGTMDLELDGKIKHIGCADPSNIWKANGYYYLQTGNWQIVENYGADLPAYQGDYTELFRSKDLKTWTYVGKFYENPKLDESYPDKTEDDMCPTFFPLPDAKCGGNLTDKYLQLFISHNRGSQYYIGELKGECFFPEKHGRFTWKDYSCFAPEALLDDKNRYIAWFWFRERTKSDGMKFGWSGAYSFPRVFWLENDVLRMAPAEELDSLQYHPQNFAPGVVYGFERLDIKNGELFRLKARIALQGARFAGFRVRASKDQTEYTDIYVDTEYNQLVFDARKSGDSLWNIQEEAPFTLAEHEMLCMDIFVDKSVIEVYVNERQAICRRVYPTDPQNATSVFAISDGASFEEVSAWEMAPTNMY